LTARLKKTRASTGKHVESELGAERHAAGAQLQAGIERDADRRTTLVLDRHQPAGGGCRLQRHAEQLQELEPIALRDQVGAVLQVLGHEGEQPDQRHARIALVEVGPFRRVHRHARESLVHQLLVAAVLELRQFDGHGRFSRPTARPTG